VFLFFLAVGACDCCVGILGDHLQAHSKGGLTKEFNDLVINDSHDILVLGSSRALHHYDVSYLSEALGMDVYNAGYKGNGIILAEGILELVLQHSHPKLILYDVEPAFDIYVYGPDDKDIRYLSFLKPYYKEPGIAQIFKDVSPKEWYKVHSGLYRYNTSIVTMLAERLVGHKMPASRFIPLTGVLQDDSEAYVNTGVAYDDLKLKYVARIIHRAGSEDIPIAFVASPKYGMADSSELDAIKCICEQNGVAFLDYYADPEFMSHREWFQEPVHLNATGAKHFSEILAKRIVSLLPSSQN